MNAQTHPRSSSAQRLWILAILLLAFALRCGGLDFQELRGDEAFGYFFSLSPFGEIVEQTLELKEPHPVASYWLQHGWLAVAGHSEFALRFAGLWWSLLAVALIVPLATLLGLPVRFAIVGALLMALSPYVIWHARDARMYSMSLALTMLSTYLAIGWWRRDAGRLWFAPAYLIVTWLALHTHYFSLYIIVAQNVAMAGWAIVERAWRKWLRWLGLGLLLLLAWLPWLLPAWETLTSYHGNGDSPRWLDALVRAQSAFGVGEAIPTEMRLWSALLTLLAMGLGGLALWRIPQHNGRAALWYLLIYWLVPLAATWVSALNRPIFNERYLVAVVPPVYLLMAAAVDGQSGARWLQWLGRAVIAGVAVGMIFGYARQMSDPQFSKTRGWRELAATLDALTAKLDPESVRLAQNYPDPTLWYYYRGAVPHLVLPPAPHDQSLASREVARMVEEGVGRVILVEQPNEAWDDAGTAQAALRDEYGLIGETEVARWPLSIWARPTADLEPLQVEYEDGLHLTGALVTPTIASPGSMVEAHLRWQDDRPVGSRQQAVSVQLLNSIGELVVQQDRPLEMASLTTAPISSYAILLPNDVAGGEYQLAVVVYDPSVEGSPRLLTTEGVDSVVLSSVTIADAPNE